MIKNVTKKEIIGWESPVAIHPGEFLSELLSEFNLKQVELSERINLEPKTISEIINGKNPITIETAFKLSKIFPLPVDYWVNLQKSYEEDSVRIKEKDRLGNEIAKYLNNFKETYSELSVIGVSYGISGFRWVSKNYSSIVLELQKFFAADSLAYIEERKQQFSFRKYERINLNPYTLSAWLRIGEIKAQKTEVSVYDEKKLEEKLDVLKKISQLEIKDYLIKVEEILASCGIVIVYMPYMKNTHVQGASKWINPNKVLLMLNTQKQDEGKFWFNLFHELGHILHDSKKEIFINTDNDNLSDIEKKADNFAQKILIPDFPTTLEEFEQNYKEKKDLEESIKIVAKKNNISTAIMAGRFTNHFKSDKRIYPIMSRFLKNKIDYRNI